MAINPLIERIKEIRFQGESYQNANKLKDKCQEMEHFLPSFHDLSSQFSSIKQSYTNLQNIGLLVELDIAPTETALATLSQKVASENYERAAVGVLKRELNRITNELGLSWKQYIDERTGSIEGVLSSLGELISEMPEKTTLQQKRALFMQEAIATPKALQAIEDYITTYNSLMSKLDLSDEVMNFLKLLTSGQKVTIADLTPTVYTWIKSSEFVNRISLSIEGISSSNSPMQSTHLSSRYR